MVARKTFATRRGNAVELLVRDGTNDAMMAESAIEADEYGLANVELGSGVAVDIGAHIGMVAIALAVDHPEARIIAVEPVPENVALMRDNLELNGVADRVEVVEAGAGKATGYMTIEYAFAGGDVADMHRFVANQTMDEGTTSKTLTVRSVSLGDLTREPVRLLVTDAEGAEYQLFGRTSVAARREKALVAEIRGEFHGSYEKLVELLDATHEVERLSAGDLGMFVARVRP